jgi:integrase
MACVRFRRGKWVVDYRDKWGKRKWRTFPGTPEGQIAANAECERIGRDGAPGVAPGITLGSYIEEHWLPVVKRRVDVLTAVNYETNARTHIPASLKRAKLASITRAQIKRFLATLGEDHGIAESTVAKVANVVRSIFESALDDELIPGNPAAGLRLSLGIVHHKAEDVRAMDASELEVFLAVAAVLVPEHHLELATLAYTGVRIGELRGLQLEDLDMGGRTIRVERQVFEDGRVGPVKGRRGKKRPRTLDMAEALHALLEPAMAARRQYSMRTGSRGPWLLYPDWLEAPGGMVKAATFRLRRAMAAVLKKARLPDHHTPHSLRHTYARVLLERGEEPLYVSRQLGHASVGITTDRYGQWARVRPRAGGANLLSGRGGGE